MPFPLYINYIIFLTTLESGDVQDGGSNMAMIRRHLTSNDTRSSKKVSYKVSLGYLLNSSRTKTKVNGVNRLVLLRKVYIKCGLLIMPQHLIITRRSACADKLHGRTFEFRFFVTVNVVEGCVTILYVSHIQIRTLV